MVSDRGATCLPGVSEPRQVSSGKCFLGFFSPQTESKLCSAAVKPACPRRLYPNQLALTVKESTFRTFFPFLSRIPSFFPPSFLSPPPPLHFLTGIFAALHLQAAARLNFYIRTLFRNSPEFFYFFAPPLIVFLVIVTA